MSALTATEYNILQAYEAELAGWTTARRNTDSAYWVLREFLLSATVRAEAALTAVAR